MTLPRLALLVLLALAAGCAAPPPPAPPPEDPAPAPERQPLPSVTYEKWRGAYTLSNATLRVTVVPTVGRIMELHYAGTNFLRNDPTLRGKRPKPGTRWMNAGGDWLWPVAQARWPAFSDGDWPPPPVLGDAPWEASAWRNVDGSQSCLLQRRYAAPVNLLVSRLITLDRAEPRLRILQRAVRVGDAGTPVTLWNISQCLAAERIYFPADPAAPAGYRPIAFGTPPDTQIGEENGVIVFDASLGGEFKVGSGATNVWIAAQRGDAVLLERASFSATGPLPDDCTVELYSNGGLGYAEIETLTPQVDLQPGESLENTVVIECLPLAASTPDAEAVRKLLDHIGPTP